MKKLTIVFLLFIVSLFLFSQETEMETETPPENEVPESLKKFDRVVFNAFWDMWQDTPEDLSINYLRSGGITIALLQDFPLRNSNFAFAFGLGITSHNLHSDGTIHYDPFAEISKFAIIDTLEYSINKLTLTFMDLPIELRFRTKKENPLKIYAGFKVGLLLQEHTKYVGDDPNSDYKIKYKEYKHHDIEKLRYGPTLRIGYKWIDIFTYYSMTSLFKKDKGPQMYPVSVGFTVSPL